MKNAANKIILPKNIKEGLEEYSDASSDETLIGNFDQSFVPNGEKIGALVNLTRTNDIRYINKFFESANAVLPQDGIFIGCVETFSVRRSKKRINKIPIIGNLYFAFDFLFLRVMPKVPLFKKVYFSITRGKNRILSKAETLGRLVSCGFEILELRRANTLLYFIVKKVDEPDFNNNPSYGLLFKMQRLGKHGKMIGVYKLRTMHPFAEYLQDYVLTKSGYASSGKPAKDFRLTPWGRVMRKYWIDELPQLLNIVVGNMKLVGVRPVTKRYFQDIPEDLQKLRLTQKPGCIPPYVALNRLGSKEEVLQSEREYLETKVKSPYTTDSVFFFRALFNIVIKNKRSA